MSSADSAPADADGVGSPADRAPAVADAPGLDLAVTAAIVSDSLDAAGVRDRTLDPAVLPLREDMRLLGRARTVQFVPTEGDPVDPYGDIMTFVDSLLAGQVVVIAAGGSSRTALWGELFSAAALGRRVAGVVCDGYVRDRSRILALGFPVFALGTRPVDYRGRMRVAGVDCTVTCAGALVDPGDLVIADDDGVAVVPRAVEAEVVDRANLRAAGERTVLAELLGGATLRTVWEEHGLL